jgi:hypothetical protein
MKEYQRVAIFTLYWLLFPLSGLSIFVVIFVCVKVKKVVHLCSGKLLGCKDVELHKFLTLLHNGGKGLTSCPSHFMSGEICPDNLSIGDWLGPRANPVGNEGTRAGKTDWTLRPVSFRGDVYGPERPSAVQALPTLHPYAALLQICTLVCCLWWELIFGGVLYLKAAA